MNRIVTLLRFGLTGWLQGPGGGRLWQRATRRVLRVVALLATLMVVYLVFRGWLYPLNPDAWRHLAHPLAASFGPGTWGGPTLLGAWLAHAAIALGIQAVCLAVIWVCRTWDRR